jgi:hypothetical protein
MQKTTKILAIFLAATCALAMPVLSMMAEGHAEANPEPPITVQLSSNAIAQGSVLNITGHATGNHANGIAIWIFGSNYWLRATEAVNDDGSFQYRISNATTQTLPTGQYHVVVQHPMQNGQYDIDLDYTDTNYVKMVTPNVERLFKVGGAGSLTGADAADALIQAIGNNNVDDECVSTQFSITAP